MVCSGWRNVSRGRICRSALLKITRFSRFKFWIQDPFKVWSVTYPDASDVQRGRAQTYWLGRRGLPGSFATAIHTSMHTFFFTIFFWWIHTKMHLRRAENSHKKWRKNQNSPKRKFYLFFLNKSWCKNSPKKWWIYFGESEKQKKTYTSMSDTGVFFSLDIFVASQMISCECQPHENKNCIIPWPAVWN